MYRKKHKNGCAGKKRHANQVGAIIHMKKLKDRGLNSYPCSKCGGWHVGHSNREEKIQARLDQLLGPDPNFADTSKGKGDLEVRRR